MEITRANFKERLPDMEAAIDSAAFLAIDGEFTGLSADKGNSPFDLPHERSDAHHVLPPGSLYHLYTNSHLYSVHQLSTTCTLTLYHLYIRVCEGSLCMNRYGRDRGFSQ